MVLRSFPTHGLYVIFERSLIPDEISERVFHICLEEGAAVIQYRDKRPPECYDLALLQRLAAQARQWSVPFLLNDHPHVAAIVGADGVHLGEQDLPLVEARRLLPPQSWIGLSCYDDLGRAVAATNDGADYVAFGSFYPSKTKPGTRRAPLGVLVQARRVLDRPLVAIGGIDTDNAPPLLAAGASLLAVAGALFSDLREASIRERIRSFTKLWQRDPALQKGRHQSPLALQTNHGDGRHHGAVERSDSHD